MTRCSKTNTKTAKCTEDALAGIICISISNTGTHVTEREREREIRDLLQRWWEDLKTSTEREKMQLRQRLMLSGDLFSPEFLPER